MTWSWDKGPDSATTGNTAIKVRPTVININMFRGVSGWVICIYDTVGVVDQAKVLIIGVWESRWFLYCLTGTDLISNSTVSGITRRITSRSNIQLWLDLLSQLLGVYTAVYQGHGRDACDVCVVSDVHDGRS